MSIGFSSYLGLIFFFWLPVFIAIYFFKKSPKKEVVSSHFLWQKVLDSKVKASWKDKFQKSALFWLQLLIFILLFFALSEPSLKGITNSGLKFAIIVDNSGSMNRKIGSSNRLYQAKELATHFVSRTSSLPTLYSWNKSFSKVSLSSDFDFDLASLQATHLADGSVGTLMKQMLQLKSTYDGVYYISDSVSPILKSFMTNNKIAYSIVDAGTENSFIEDILIEKDSMNKYYLKVNYYSYDSDPVEFRIKTYNLDKSITDLATRRGKNSFKIPLKNHPEVWLSVKMLKQDGLLLDNEKTRFMQGKKSKIKFVNLDKFPLWRIFFKGFFQGDSRFEIVESGQTDMSFYLVSKLPDKMLENSLYILTAPVTRSASTENFALSNVNDITAYLSVEGFAHTSKDIKPLKAENLIVSIFDSGEKVPLLAKVTNSIYYLNLSETIENIVNSNTSILFENLIENFRKVKSQKSYYEVGDLLNGFSSTKASSSWLVGTYRLDNMKRFYNFPTRESFTNKDTTSDRNYFIEVDEENTTKTNTGSDHIFLLLVSLALATIFIEWFTFIGRL